MYPVTASLSSEQIKLENTRLVDMYVINASLSGIEYAYYINNNQDVYGYELNASGNLTATEVLYTGLPITKEAISNNIQGEIPSFSISIPNVDRSIESIIQNYGYLRGRDIHIIVGFAKYLPTGSTAYHIGEVADKNSFIKEKMFIDAPSSDNTMVSLACRPKFDIKAAVIPSRKYMNKCAWAISDRYLGTECRASVNSASFPTCDGTLTSCKERDNEARFGGFTSIPSKGYSIL